MVQVRYLELDVLDHRSVLLQVVGVCHQRGCEVVSLRYDREHGAGRIALSVRGETPRVERLAHWLSRLVHVLDVRHLAPVPQPAASGAQRAVASV
jgi:acetolactate synthase small subunit